MNEESIYQTFRNIVINVVNGLGLPDEMADAIVETTELKSKEALLKESYEGISEINDILAKGEPFITQKDIELFDNFLRKCALGHPVYDEYCELKKYISNELTRVPDMLKKSAGIVREEVLLRLEKLSRYPMLVWAISDNDGRVIGNYDTIVYAENSKENSVEEIISGETGHVLSLKLEKDMHPSISEVYDIAAAEAAGFPYSGECLENNALLGKITMEHLNENERNEILEHSSIKLVSDYNNLVTNMGSPSHQEAAYVYKKLKEKFGARTLKVLGSALFNPEVKLDSPISFYNTTTACYKTA